MVDKTYRSKKLVVYLVILMIIIPIISMALYLYAPTLPIIGNNNKDISINIIINDNKLVNKIINSDLTALYFNLPYYGLIEGTISKYNNKISLTFNINNKMIKTYKSALYATYNFTQYMATGYYVNEDIAFKKIIYGKPIPSINLIAINYTLNGIEGYQLVLPLHVLVNFTRQGAISDPYNIKKLGDIEYMVSLLNNGGSHKYYIDSNAKLALENADLAWSFNTPYEVIRSIIENALNVNLDEIASNLCINSLDTVEFTGSGKAVDYPVYYYLSPKIMHKLNYLRNYFEGYISWTGNANAPPLDEVVNNTWKRYLEIQAGFYFVPEGADYRDFINAFTYYYLGNTQVYDTPPSFMINDMGLFIKVRGWYPDERYYVWNDTIYRLKLNGNIISIHNYPILEIKINSKDYVGSSEDAIATIELQGAKTNVDILTFSSGIYVGPAGLGFSIINIEFETNIVKKTYMSIDLSAKSVGVYAKLNYEFGKDLGILLYYIKPVTDACNRSYTLVKPILLIIPSITFDLEDITVKKDAKTPKIDATGLLTIYAEKMIVEYTHPRDWPNDYPPYNEFPIIALCAWNGSKTHNDVTGLAQVTLAYYVEFTIPFLTSSWGDISLNSLGYDGLSFMGLNVKGFTVNFGSIKASSVTYYYDAIFSILTSNFAVSTGHNASVRFYGKYDYMTLHYLALTGAFSTSDPLMCKPPADKIFEDGSGIIREYSPVPFTNQIKVVIKSLINSSSNPITSTNSSYSSGTNSTQNNTSNGGQDGGGTGSGGDSPVPYCFQTPYGQTYCFQVIQPPET